MPFTVHLSGSTAARVILAGALLLVAVLLAVVCAPGLPLWPLYPGRAGTLLGQLFRAADTWSRAIITPTVSGGACGPDSPRDSAAVEPGEDSSVSTALTVPELPDAGPDVSAG